MRKEKEMPTPKTIPLYSIEDVVESAKQVSKTKTEEQKETILEYVSYLLGRSEDAVWEMFQE